MPHKKDSSFRKLSIVVPVYNEGATVCAVFDKIREVELPGDIKRELIVVNDGSTDGSEQVILDYASAHSDLDIRYFAHPANKGKGAAVRTGIQRASGQYLVIQDADLEYNPQEYGLLVKPALDGVADIVYGSRFVGGRPHRVLFFWHTIGNRLLTLFSNLCSDLNLTDMETGYKLFKTDIIQSIQLNENGFGFEPEVTAKIAKIDGIRVYEVGISYYGRTYADGKKIGWRDGFRALYCIIRYNLFGG